jgi:hypothetical protein
MAVGLINLLPSAGRSQFIFHSLSHGVNNDQERLSPRRASAKHSLAQAFWFIGLLIDVFLKKSNLKMGFWKINGLPQQNRNNRKISSIPVPII